MYGMDYLGGARYSKIILASHPRDWAAGFFANTFGNAWPTIKALASTGRCPRIRIHAVWDDLHVYNPARHDPIIDQELKRANALKDSFPALDVEFSFFCEHNIRGAQLKKLYSRCAAAAKNITIINSVWQGDIIAGAVNEVHGSKASPPRQGAYNFSFDGSSAVDSDVETILQRHRGADTFYFWVPQFNLKLTTEDKTPRPQRQAVPTKKLIESVAFLSTPKGGDILPKDWLWKSHADQHEAPKPEARAGKPVLLAPLRVNKFELITNNGTVVGSLPYYGKFDDGRERYYLNQWGYEVARKAVQAQGDPVLRLRAGDRIFGAVNAAFRCGVFR